MKKRKKGQEWGQGGGGASWKKITSQFWPAGRSASIKKKSPISSENSSQRGGGGWDQGENETLDPSRKRKRVEKRGGTGVVQITTSKSSRTAIQEMTRLPGGIRANKKEGGKQIKEGRIGKKSGKRLQEFKGVIQAVRRGTA